MWLAVSAFTVKCSVIGYAESKSVTLSLPGVGTYSSAPSLMMSRDLLADLERWTFECTVVIRSMRYSDGRRVLMSTAADQRDDNVLVDIPSVSTAAAPSMDEQQRNEIEVLQDSNTALAVK